MKNPLLLPRPTRTRAGWPCISSNMLVWIFCSPLHAGVQIGTSHIHTHIHTYTRTHTICMYKSKYALSTGRIKTGTGLLGRKGDKMQIGIPEIDQIKSRKSNT